MPSYPNELPSAGVIPGMLSSGAPPAPTVTNASSNYSSPYASSYGGYNQTPFNLGSQALGQAGSLVSSVVSPESRDRAAARLRSWSDTAGRANEQTYMDQQNARGRADTGMTDRGLGDIRRGTQENFSRGLADMESQYDQTALKAGELMSGIGQNYGTLGNQQGTLQLGEAVGMGRLGVDQQNADTSLYGENVNAYGQGANWTNSLSGLLNSLTGVYNANADAAHTSNDDMIRSWLAFAQNANVFNNPGGNGAMVDFFKQLGMDPSTFSFFQPPGSGGGGSVPGGVSTSHNSIDKGK